MSALISHAQHAASSAGKQIQTTTDKLFPPQQRDQKLKELHTFANRNPKLATFLAVQITLTGIPLLLFILFAISTLLISLSTCLLFAITTAFIYTLFAVGIALIFLIPTLFIASCAASCFFLWGLVVYMILRRLNEGEEPAKPGTRVGDKLHGLTGGKLEWMVDGEARGEKHVNGHEWEKKWDGVQEQHKDHDEGYGEEKVGTPQPSS
ncbi:hypothetical protein GQ44DRAFT_766268 [Phaeosphaeriaceae sp. PMI808]|nr:hypothetical protein GQ44DRAFT_766268 [Phaeosphaeriaceae sp. PMI808]